MAPAATWQLQLGLAKETTLGTAVPATTFLPVKTPKFIVKYATIRDDAMRGNASMDQAYYQGEGYTEVDTGDMHFYPDDSLHFLMAVLGVDTITGAGPYTHPLTLLNTGRPPSYTFQKYDSSVATVRQVAGVLINDVSLKFTTTNSKLILAAKGKGRIATNATKQAAAYSTAGMLLPWQAALTLAGGGNIKLLDFQLNLKRAVDLIFGAQGTQDSTDGNVGPLEVTGKMTFASADYTEYNYYLNNTQPITSIVFTSGANTFTIQMSKTAFEDPTDLDHGSTYLKTSASFRAIANATDAGTGNSPIKFIGVNTRATAY